MDKILQVFSSSTWRTGTYRAGPLLTPELNIGPSMQALNPPSEWTKSCKFRAPPRGTEPPSEWTKSCKFRTPPRDSANIDVGGYGGSISSLDSFDDISRIKMLSVRTCKILSINRRLLSQKEMKDRVWSFEL